MARTPKQVTVTTPQGPRTVDVEIVPIESLAPDENNANLGTLRGEQLLNTSIERLGLGRGVVADKHGKLIGGNKTQGRAVDLGFEEAILVHTDGRRLVVTVRDDLDLDSDEDTRARELAIADNRVGEVNLAWDAKALQALQDSQPDSVGNYFHPEEVERIVATAESEGAVKDSSKDQGKLDFPDLGDPDQFWPEIKVKVHPDAYARYQDLQTRVDGPGEGQRLALILEIAETALNAEEGDA